MALAGAGYWSSRSLAAPKSPNEKLNIGLIGTGIGAEANIDGVQGENIVAALRRRRRALDAAGEKLSARRTRYNDFRKLLEQDEHRRRGRQHARPHPRLGHARRP